MPRHDHRQRAATLRRTLAVKCDSYLRLLSRRLPRRRWSRIASATSAPRRARKRNSDSRVWRGRHANAPLSPPCQFQPRGRPKRPCHEIFLSLSLRRRFGATGSCAPLFMLPRRMMVLIQVSCNSRVKTVTILFALRSPAAVLRSQGCGFRGCERTASLEKYPLLKLFPGYS